MKKMSTPKTLIGMAFIPMLLSGAIVAQAAMQSGVDQDPSLNKIEAYAV